MSCLTLMQFQLLQVLLIITEVKTLVWLPHTVFKLTSSPLKFLDQRNEDLRKSNYHVNKKKGFSF